MTTMENLWDAFKANKDAIALGIALIGAGFGVLKLWRDIRMARCQEQYGLRWCPRLER